MLNPVYTRQFERDIKRLKRRGKNLEKLKIIICSLVAEEPLDPIHKDHTLIDNWQGRRECPNQNPTRVESLEGKFKLLWSYVLGLKFNLADSSCDNTLIAQIRFK